MGLSRQEVNLRRLLAKCELMVKNNQKEDERFGKYVNSLEDMLQEVRSTYESSNNETLQNYQKRITAIKIAVGISLNQFEMENDSQLTRNELLGVRHRNITKPNVGEGDLDSVINYHEERQKKITDDMVSIAKTLKEQSQLANTIIKKDTEVVGRATQLTEQNFDKLGVESVKLTEHSKKAWKCWMWVLLVIVMVVFINMVLFMKVMKKRQ
ncbi:unnamed protein product [Brassicogethes aeneus]|uniref:Vesicle transport protein USE1 n=1 Tax=Brassicogethes aeneus TaxID=1431903 RepID=A0A9P0FF85_BRAAE|nr:unnamed protein product [Brassicogethes aeneus]